MALKMVTLLWNNSVNNKNERHKAVISFRQKHLKSKGLVSFYVYKCKS